MDKTIHHGGLYRCCIEYAARQTIDAEGARITCPYCSARMIVRDGEWRWEGADPAVELATCPRCGDPLTTTPCSTCEAIQNGSFGAE